MQENEYISLLFQIVKNYKRTHTQSYGISRLIHLFSCQIVRRDRCLPPIRFPIPCLLSAVHADNKSFSTSDKSEEKYIHGREGHPKCFTPAFPRKRVISHGYCFQQRNEDAAGK